MTISRGRGDNTDDRNLTLVYRPALSWPVDLEVPSLLGGAQPCAVYLWDLPADEEGRVQRSLAEAGAACATIERLAGPEGLSGLKRVAGEGRRAVVFFGLERAREAERFLGEATGLPVQLVPEGIDLRREAIVGALWRLYELTWRLRRECPWDRKQTQESIVAYTLEETYELIDTVRDRARLGAESDAAVRSELGDLLFQVYFIACVAEEQHLYDLGEVATAIHDKLVRRHPHVFGDVEAETADDVRRNWDTIKKEAEGREGIFHEIPHSFPAPLLAQKLQQRAASVGFDWERPADVLAKFKEETAEIEEALAAGKDAAVAAEVGDLLFAVVNLARKLKVDPELALRGSALRFRERVEEAARLAGREGRVFEDLELDEQESYYNHAKESLKR